MTLSDPLLEMDYCPMEVRPQDYALVDEDMIPDRAPKRATWRKPAAALVVLGVAVMVVCGVVFTTGVTESDNLTEQLVKKLQPHQGIVHFGSAALGQKLSSQMAHVLGSNSMTVSHAHVASHGDRVSVVGASAVLGSEAASNHTL